METVLHIEALEILLHSLCGVHKQQFRIHEFCLRSMQISVSITTFFRSVHIVRNMIKTDTLHIYLFLPGSVSSEVRILCDLEQAVPTWIVRHIGGSMRGAGAEQMSVLVRSVVESKASKNIFRFFYALGYKLDHELLKVGFSFHFQRTTQLKLHAIEEAVPVAPGIQLVEVTSLSATENYNEVVSAISSFSEYLAPYSNFCGWVQTISIFLLCIFSFTLLHLSKPGVPSGVVPTAAAAAAASLMSDRSGQTL
ncbi:hypothetical protein ACHQM5_002014 [Ranunculus cassubicifolius]